MAMEMEMEMEMEDWTGCSVIFCCIVIRACPADSVQLGRRHAQEKRMIACETPNKMSGGSIRWDGDGDGDGDGGEWR